MVRPGLLIYFYLLRLRTHPIQEALAGLGIAVGVALLFAVQVANNSVVGSASAIAEAVTGDADVQVLSRDSRGFDARVVERIRDLGLPCWVKPARLGSSVGIGRVGSPQRVDHTAAREFHCFVHVDT